MSEIVDHDIQGDLVIEQATGARYSGIEVLINPAGNVFNETEFRDGTRTGVFIQRHPDSGQVVAIQYFEGGLKNGPSLTFFRNGMLRSRSEYLKGKQNGRFVSYHENGFIKETGLYREDKRDSRWEAFSETGDLMLVEMYSNGSLVSQEAMQASGIPKPPKRTE